MRRRDGMFSILRLFPLGLAALIPVSLVIAALFVTRRSPFGASSIAAVMCVELSVFAVALRALFARVLEGGAAPKLPPIAHDLVQLDLASSAMLVLVCTLGVVVVRYSRTYLAGERGLVRYSRSLLLTLAAATLLVIANHLALLVAGWMATVVTLHQLLTFYPKRRQAVIVAHKKFLLGQIANLCFLASLALMQSEIGSLRIDVVNAFARAHEALSPSLHLATVLFVFGVLLKTAQLPFHGWILQVMEAPTPVSALLHAGVVNIGGFVMIRLSPLMGRATIAQGVLIVVGLVTAIVGSLVMTTRSSVKVTLAWSTIAQMGLMLVQCGLGVWHLALLHLLAHSLYKAHAFLSAGSVVDTWRGASLVRPSPPSVASVGAGVVAVALAAAPLYVAFSRSAVPSSTSLATFAMALALSFVPMMAKAIKAGARAFGLGLLYMFGAAAAYFALHAAFDEIASTLDTPPPTPLGWGFVGFGLVVLFVAQTFLQISPHGRVARLLQPHLRGGLYLDDWFTRLTFRLWPPRLERPATASRRSSVTLEAR